MVLMDLEFPVCGTQTGVIGTVPLFDIRRLTFDVRDLKISVVLLFEEVGLTDSFN